MSTLIAVRAYITCRASWLAWRHRKHEVPSASFTGFATLWSLRWFALARSRCASVFAIWYFRSVCIIWKQKRKLQFLEPTPFRSRIRHFVFFRRTRDLKQYWGLPQAAQQRENYFPYLLQWLKVCTVLYRRPAHAPRGATATQPMSGLLTLYLLWDS